VKEIGGESLASKAMASRANHEAGLGRSGLGLWLQSISQARIEMTREDMLVEYQLIQIADKKTVL
jgi:hypothetical protein